MVITPNTKWTLLFVLILGAVVASLFSGTVLCGEFPWDDEELLLSIGRLRTSKASPLTPVSGNFMPVTMLSLSIDHFLSGGTLKGYHITNVFFHVLNTVLVMFLAKSFGARLVFAFLAALAFGIHPTQVETVAWIAERKNLLFVLFAMLSCLTYVRFLGSGNKGWYSTSLLLFMLCVLAKPQGVSLPLFLLAAGSLVHPIDRPLGRIVQLLPFALVAFAAAALAFNTQQGAGYVHWDRGMGFPLNLLVTLSAFSTYLLRILVPWDLSIFHPLPDRIGPWLMFTSAITLVLIVLSVVLALRGRYRTLWWLALYLAAVLPIIHLIPFGAAHTADRYAYLPSVVMVSGAAVLLSRSWPPLKWNVPIGVFLGTVLMIALSMATVHQTRLWCNPIGLFQDAALRYPDNAIILFNIGSLHFKAGSPIQAEEAYTQALNADPGSMEALVGLAQAAGASGQTNKALERYAQVIAVTGDHRTGRTARTARARLFIDNARFSEAIVDLEHLVNTGPEEAINWYLLGLAQAGSNDHGLAIRNYRKALQLGYVEQDLYLNLAISLGWKESFSEAIPLLRELLRNNPNSAEGHFLLGLSLQRSGMNGCEALLRAFELGHPRAGAAAEQYCKARPR